MLIDATAINVSLWAGLSHQLTMRSEPSVYTTEPLFSLVGAHVMVSIAFVLMYFYNGIYSARRYSIKNTFFSGILSSALVLSAIHFLTSYNLTGFGIGLALAISSVILWRETLPRLVRGVKGLIFAPENALIIGHDEDIARYISNLDKRRRTRVKGVVRIGRDSGTAGCIDGYPVFGGMDGLEGALASTRADTLLIVASEPWYSDIINLLAQYRGRGVDVRWETME
jgi:FlaA1/EpsC-like NDP-sugar epimerase